MQHVQLLLCNQSDWCSQDARKGCCLHRSRTSRQAASRTCSLPEPGTRATVSMMPRTIFAVFALGTAANRGRSSVSSWRSASALPWAAYRSARVLMAGSLTCGEPRTRQLRRGGGGRAAYGDPAPGGGEYAESRYIVHEGQCHLDGLGVIGVLAEHNISELCNGLCGLRLLHCLRFIVLTLQALCCHDVGMDRLAVCGKAAVVQALTGHARHAHASVEVFTGDRP